MTHTAIGRVARFRCLVAFAAVLRTTSGCAMYRAPTVAHLNELSAGIGGLGKLVTNPSDPDAFRSGAGSAVLWKAGYAHCLDKGDGEICIEAPVDFVGSSTIKSLNLSAPQSVSTIFVTPGIRLENNLLPFGYIPFNFFALGFGAARLTTGHQLLDGSAASPQTQTGFAIRVDAGLKVLIGKRFGLRAGVLIEGAPVLGDWFHQAGVVPLDEEPSTARVGGYVVVYRRR